jgi:hypothetical protein
LRFSVHRSNAGDWNERDEAHPPHIDQASGVTFSMPTRITAEHHLEQNTNNVNSYRAVMQGLPILEIDQHGRS